MKVLWKIAKIVGITLLTSTVILILIAEYRSYADKVEQYNLDRSRRTIQADAHKRI